MKHQHIPIPPPLGHYAQPMSRLCREHQRINRKPRVRPLEFTSDRLSSVILADRDSHQLIYGHRDPSFTWRYTLTQDRNMPTFQMILCEGSALHLRLCVHTQSSPFFSSCNLTGHHAGSEAVLVLSGGRLALLLQTCHCYYGNWQHAFKACMGPFGNLNGNFGL